MKTQRCCAVDPLIRVELEEELKKQLGDAPDERSLKKNSEILFGLSHPLRLKIAFLLMKSNYCVCEIVKMTGKKQNLVSHHLAIMKKNGVVNSYLKSRWKYYRINENAIRILKSMNLFIS